MERIKSDRVGYIGFKCNRENAIKDIVDVHRIVGDTSVNRVVFSSKEELQEDPCLPDWLNNYLNIPTQLAGSMDILEYAAGIGKADYEYVAAGSNDFQSLNLIFPVFNTLDGTDCSSQGTGEDLELKPGILNMLSLDNAFRDTQLYIDIASNRYEDGNLVAQMQQEKRNKLVDEQLDNINWSTVNNAVLSMFEALHSMSPCPNFRIRIKDGHLMHKIDSEDRIPTFEVTGGTVYVKDSAIAATNTIGEIQGDFDLGVEITLYDPSGDPFNYYMKASAKLIARAPYGSIGDSFSHGEESTTITRRLGGVCKVPFVFNNIAYVTYSIERSPCYIHIPPYYVSKDGVLYAVAGGSIHYALDLYDCSVMKSNIGPEPEP